MAKANEGEREIIILKIYQPGVAGEIEVVVSDVGDVGNSLGGRLEMGAPLPIAEYLVLTYGENSIDK